MHNVHIIVNIRNANHRLFHYRELQNTDGIWEVRAAHGNNAFRLLSFFDDGNLVILTNGFAKKTQKTPPEEIKLAEQRKKDYLRRRKYE